MECKLLSCVKGSTTDFYISVVMTSCRKDFHFVKPVRSVFQINRHCFVCLFIYSSIHVSRQVYPPYFKVAQLSFILNDFGVNFFEHFIHLSSRVLARDQT